MQKAHQAQLAATPFWRTSSATRFGVSVEKVVATIEVPSSHQGSRRPARKNESLSFAAKRTAQSPMASAAPT